MKLMELYFPRDKIVTSFCNIISPPPAPARCTSSPIFILNHLHFHKNFSLINFSFCFPGSGLEKISPFAHEGTTLLSNSALKTDSVRRSDLRTRLDNDLRARWRKTIITSLIDLILIYIFPNQIRNGIDENLVEILQFIGILCLNNLKIIYFIFSNYVCFRFLIFDYIV